MFTRSTSLKVSIVVLLVLVLTPQFVLGQEEEEVLRLYGPIGPSPAIEEAAMVFASRHNVQIQVTAGPRNMWRDKATVNADLMFSSAEFMMSNYVRAMDLRIDDASITPLYLRPSAILVRPGNPKQINDFPDLVRPGIRVMVVNGSGHTGLWEDMAGKLQDIRTLRALRRNIAVFAGDSEEAMNMWNKREDIDAWITWNTWHIPLRDRAKLIPVSRDYRVLRQCSIAQTERGKSKPLAKEFIKFLSSDEASQIFDTWGWLTREGNVSPVTITHDIAIVCRIDEDSWNKDVGEGLASLRKLMADYEAIGMSPKEVHVSAIFHGDAAYWLLKDEAYSGYLKREGANPNKAIIQELLDLGVSLEICNQTMKANNWKQEDVTKGVKVVPGAYPRLIDLELQGYAYIRF